MDQNSWIILAALAAFFLWRWWRFRAVTNQLPELMKQGAIVIDVRSPGEFATGHFEGSINIPVEHLAAKAQALDKSKPIVLCCASGSRSGLCAGILRSQGFTKVFNAGPWTNLLKTSQG